MAKSKNNEDSQPESAGASIKHLERLTRLVALLVVKGESQNEKISVLANSGFSNIELAGLLGLSPNTVNLSLHRTRAKKKRKSKK